MKDHLLKGRRGIIKLLPLILLYSVIVIWFSENTLFGDENRHLQYASNLSQGYYTSQDNPELRNGPGYPILMLSLSSWDAPYIAYKFLNALLMFLATVLFYKSLLLYITPVRALFLSYLFGTYPPLLRYMIYIYSESLSIFLACAFAYFFLKRINNESSKNLNTILSCLFLGYLAMTKVIFGYVILTAAVLFLIYFIFKRSKKVKISLLIVIGSFMTCLPYLAYTYSITGEMFYWGSGGGEILYWRSSPYPNEYGDWISRDVALGKVKNKHFDHITPYENHGSFLESLEPYSNFERDVLYKEAAITNMRNHPLKYVKNTAASGIRLFFNYPYSYTAQSPSSLFYIIPNGILLALTLLAFLLALSRPASIQFEIWFLGMIALITLGGLTMGNGMARYLLPVIPFLGIFVIYVLDRMVKLKLAIAAK